MKKDLLTRLEQEAAELKIAIDVLKRYGARNGNGASNVAKALALANGNGHAKAPKPKSGKRGSVTPLMLKALSPSVARPIHELAKRSGLTRGQVEGYITRNPDKVVRTGEQRPYAYTRG